MSASDYPPAHRPPAGFTLLELLVVLTVIALLAGLIWPALARARARAQGILCAGQLHQIDLAIRMYAGDHQDQWPRSQHSAFAHRQLPWGPALAPYLGNGGPMWTNLLATIYHCPADRRPRPWSYGLNVYFELGPHDDYPGKPQTWRRVSLLPHPTETVLMAENATEADHFMAHFWERTQDVTEVARHRHGERSNYLYGDGHVRSQRFDATYRPDCGLDRWHPDP